jgi:hypothetical protein
MFRDNLAVRSSRIKNFKGSLEGGTERQSRNVSKWQHCVTSQMMEDLIYVAAETINRARSYFTSGCKYISSTVRTFYQCELKCTNLLCSRLNTGVVTLPHRSHHLTYNGPFSTQLDHVRSAWLRALPRGCPSPSGLWVKGETKGNYRNQDHQSIIFTLNMFTKKNWQC